MVTNYYQVSSQGRSLHSTLTALLEATNNWSVDIDEGLLNGVVFIDLPKAFDTTDHKIISRKMSLIGDNQEAMRGSCRT